LELFLLFVPFRHGEMWARWAIPAGGLVISIGALYAMAYVSLNTQASPPLIAPVAGILLFVAGLILSLAQPRV
jgi:protein-S-isoprenylcysteine O-methyltransferase Ste14